MASSATSGAAARFAAETWFLQRGLPSVLRPGVLVRRLWQRSAPALAALAVFMVNSMALVAITDRHTVNIIGQPTRTEWFILGMVLLVAPVALAVGGGVARIAAWRGRAVAAAVSLAVCAAGAVFGGPTPRVGLNLVYVGVLVAIILACTGCGIGSVLGWALNVTVHNLSLIGNLFMRVLPILLLTVLVFFNTYVWLMAAIVSRARLWCAVGFLALIAVVFIIATTVDQARPALTAPDPDSRTAERTTLVGTPFEQLPDPHQRIPLSRMEYTNVVFVLAMSQVLQALVAAAVTAAIFFVLGLILLSPQLLGEWTHNGAADGTLLGMTLPIPQALIQITLFLGAMTFMYLSGRAASDADYRQQFIDTQVADLRRTLDARNRYRAESAP